MDGVKFCWICKGEFLKPFPVCGDRVKIDCTLCGEYEVTHSAAGSEFPLADPERYRLSSWTKQRQLDKRSPPVFSSHSMQDIVSSLPKYEPNDKLDVLLQSISKLSPNAGAWHQPDFDRNYSWACAADHEEFRYFLFSLVALDLLERNAGNGNVRVSARGWQRLSALKENPSTSRVGFVAIRFVEEMLALFETSFRPAIEEAGFKGEISGSPTHNERIDAKIMAQIKGSRFVVADVTHENQGVYFEAGYAIGLARPVIWTCRVDKLKDLHFDTRQYNHIVWRDGSDLRAQLRDRIVATI